MSYRCAAGITQHTDLPCPKCGATESSEYGCEGTTLAKPGDPPKRSTVFYEGDLDEADRILDEDFGASLNIGYKD